MSNGIKRIGKGLFAIFMIKLTLLGGVLAFQACQTESNFDNGVSEEAKTNFLAALQESNQRIREINLKKLSDDTHNNDKYEFTAKDDESPLTLKQICLEVLLGSTNDSLTNTSDPIDTSDVNTLGDVFDIADATNTRPVAINDSIVNDVANDPIAFGFSMCFDIQTEPIEAALDPATIAAKDFFYSKGFNDQDISEMLDGEDEATLIPIVMQVAYSQQNSQASIDFMSIFINSANAQSSARDCFLETTGIAAGASLVAALTASTMDKKLVKKLVKETVKKIGGRVLGGIGLAILIIDFTYCMLAQ